MIVVEVSNADGAWGLYFRLEDAGGRKLEIAPDGSLRSPTREF